MNEEIGIGTRIKHSEYGDGIICRIGIEYLSISFFKGGLREIERGSDDLEVIEFLEGGAKTVSFEEVEDYFLRLLRRYAGESEKTDMAPKWMKGTLELHPGDSGLQGKTIPIDTFFHKIVMVRDRLRVLEQQINSHPKLDDGERVQLQQYITRIYGSLTTFNVLFKNKEDYFVGESKD